MVYNLSLCYPMQIKDYYTILEVPPSATLPEIKRSYRRLAQQYHPDKNGNTPSSAAIFSDIKEAYEVLTNPAKKEHYLQQRWYNQSAGKRKQPPTFITPASVVIQALELEKYISRLDHFRMDKEGLYNYVSALIPDETIERLNSFEDPDTNAKIVTILLACCKPLSFSSVLLLQKQLNKINVGPSVVHQVNEYILMRQKEHSKEKYKTWIVVLIVALICLLIFLQGS